MNLYRKFARMKTIAVVAVLAASPALAQQAPPSAIDVPTVVPKSSCTGANCASVLLMVMSDQCLWAVNSEQSPIVLGLTLANGTAMQLMLKSSGSYTRANAPYDNPSCDTLDKQVQAVNEHGRPGDAEALASMPGMVQLLKTCNANEMAAREANRKKGEYYEINSRTVPVRRKNLMGSIVPAMITQTYVTYWVQLKNGASCFDAVHDIKSYTADATQTIGTWIVSSANGRATAVLTPAAITVPLSGSPAPGADTVNIQLELQYGKLGTISPENTFKGSSFGFSHALPPYLDDTVYHILADGKDVGQFGGSAGVPGISGVGDLTTMFGADLAGLTSVQQISVVSKNAPTGDTTFFAANLQQTAAALAAMKVFAAAL
jgi:hypothetical protein